MQHDDAPTQRPVESAPGVATSAAPKAKRNREIDAQLRSAGARARFLKALAHYGVVGYACTKAKVSRRSAYQWRETHTEFAMEWDAAITASIDRLECEAMRRGCDGTVVVAYDRNGKRVGSTRTYSDRLLEFVLSAKKDEYRVRRVEMTGKDGGAIDVNDTGADVKRKLLSLADAAASERDTVATDE